MDILLIFPGFILVIIVVIMYEIELRKLQNKSYNKVHFYVARDRASFSKGMLNLWIEKPERGVNIWYGGTFSRHITIEGNFCFFGLNPSDYDNLKWEDEPVEVFINLED